MLYQKARPERLEDVIGNRSAVRTLMAMLRRKEVPHALLVQGSPGCGKTTIARIMAKELGAGESGLTEINAANFRGIDDARNMARDSRYSPLMDAVKVFIIDEAQGLTKDAQNCLLKPIEDSAEHSYFMFCTTDPEKIIPTIRNRCTVIQVGLLTEEELRTLINSVCKRFDLMVNEEIKEAVIQTSEGCPRAALVKLEAVEHITDLDEALAVVVEGTELQKEVIDLCRLVASPKAKWSQVSDTFKALSVKDCEKVRYAILGYLKSCLLRSRGEEAAWFAAKLKVFCESTFYSGEAGLVRLLYEAATLE